MVRSFLLSGLHGTAKLPIVNDSTWRALHAADGDQWRRADRGERPCGVAARGQKEDAESPRMSLRIVSVSVADRYLTVNFSTSGDMPAHGADLIAVLADDSDRSNVLRGENSGTTLAHVAVARSISRVAKVKTAGEQTVQIPIPASFQATPGHHLILFAQTPGNGRVLGTDTKTALENDRMATELRDESRMIASILAGETQLFHELIRPYERRVYAMALSFLHNEADAEDAAQEAFLKAFRNLASFRGEAKFGTWLVSITLNEARSRIRRRDASRWSRWTSLRMKRDTLRRLCCGTGRRYLPRRWSERKSAAVASGDHRSAARSTAKSFSCRDIEQLSVNEAAEALGITIASVKVRLHRARMMLQKNLAPQLKEMAPKRRWWAWS